MKLFKLISILGLLGAAGSLFALEIPLDHSSFSTTKQKAAKMAIVDIEKVFNEHPMTLRLKSEFQAEVDKRKKEIDDLDSQINRLNSVIASSSTEIMIQKENVKRMQELPLPGTFQAQESTQSAEITMTTAPVISPQPNIQASIADIEAKIREKESEIEIMKTEALKLSETRKTSNKKALSELPLLEEKHTQAVLNDIYDVLKKIAAEDDLTSILDKTNILFGPGDQDITQKVLERIQGR